MALPIASHPVLHRHHSLERFTAGLAKRPVLVAGHQLAAAGPGHRPPTRAAPPADRERPQQAVSQCPLVELASPRQAVELLVAQQGDLIIAAPVLRPYVVREC